MSANEPFLQLDQQSVRSSGLSLNLSSNNPFRNRAASPASLDSPKQPVSPFDDPAPQRPVSRNPFFDQSQPQPQSQSLPKPPAVMAHSPDNKSLSAEEIFNSLTLDDKPKAADGAKPKAPGHPPPPRPQDRKPAPRRGENVPPSSGGPRHRLTRSQEEELRARKASGSGGPSGPDKSPQRKPVRRPRRNSDSSLMDFDSQPLTEEEKKMIEAKRREAARRERGPAREGREGREGRESREPREPRDDKDKDRKDRSTRPAKPSRRLDIIDQLDATSIYGTGLFHHDGPFDALNPHRNRQSSRRAPMQAFPKDSLNNSLGGAGPLNSQADHSAFMGNATDEAFRDFARSGRNKSQSTEMPIFDPISRGKVYGDDSYGLGASTFLEGTPAAKTTIARHQAERAQDAVDTGLQRKKSLAQRIRHINKGPRDYPSGRITDPQGLYSKRSPDPQVSSSGTGQESNPFFAEFSKGEDSISVQPRDGALSPDAGSGQGRRGSGQARRGSNGGPLERRVTADAAATLTEEAPAVKPTGLLGRMKSLKAPRKPRNIEPAPGTAL